MKHATQAISYPAYPGGERSWGVVGEDELAVDAIYLFHDGCVLEFLFSKAALL